MEVDDVHLSNGQQEMKKGNLSEFFNDSNKKISPNNKNTEPLLDKNVKISILKLKSRYVISKKFRRIHRLKHSNVSSISRQLLNMERKCNKMANAKRVSALNDELLNTMASFTDEEMATNNNTNEEFRGDEANTSNVSECKGNVHSVQDINDENNSNPLMTDQKEISSISFQTSSGYHSIATRAVKICKKLSTSQQNSRLLSDEIERVKTNERMESDDICCTKSPINIFNGCNVLEVVNKTPKKTNNASATCSPNSAKEIPSVNSTVIEKIISDLSFPNDDQQTTMANIDSVVNITEKESLPTNIVENELLSNASSILSDEDKNKDAKMENHSVELTEKCEETVTSGLETSPAKSSVPFSSPEKTSVPLSSPEKTSVPLSSPEKTSVPLSSHEKTSVPLSSHEKTSVPLSSHEKTSVPLSSPEETSVPLSSPEETSVPLSSPEKTTVPFSSPAKNLIPLSSPAKVIVDNDCFVIDPVETVSTKKTLPTNIKQQNILSATNKGHLSIEEIGSTFAANKVSIENEVLENMDSMESENIESKSSSPNENNCSASYKNTNSLNENNLPNNFLTPNVIPESNVLQYIDNEECLFIEKVESISPESAAALISEGDLNWDNDILPTNFLQCDMKVHETETGNSIYNDSKLLMHPTVVINKLVSSDLNEDFQEKHKLSIFSQLYCRSLLKSTMSSKKEKKRILPYKPGKNTEMVQMYSGEIKDYNSKKRKQMCFDVIDVETCDKANGTPQHNIAKECISNPLLSSTIKESENNKSKNPTQIKSTTKIDRGGRIDDTLDKPNFRDFKKGSNMNAFCKSYIRPKPLSLLMEHTPSPIQNLSSPANTDISGVPSESNCFDGRFSRMPVPGKEDVYLEISGVAKVASAIPGPSQNLEPPVNTYTLTHSIFGSLVDTDKNVEPKQANEISVSTVPNFPFHGQTYAPIPYNPNVIQQPVAGCSPIRPNQFSPSTAVPLFTRPVNPVNNNYPQNTNNYNRFPLSNTTRLYIPPTYPDLISSRRQPDFNQPLLLLQQPYIPLQGGVVLQKERAEEELNSVREKCKEKHSISHDLIERVSTLLKNMQDIGYPDSTYSLQHASYQILVSNGACCLTEAIIIVNSKRFRSMMSIPESAPKYTRPTVPSVEKVVMKFFPGYKMFVLKRFTFAIDSISREIIFPMPPFCLPKHSAVVDKVTVLLLLSPTEGFGPGLVVLPHAILTNKLRCSLSNETMLDEWGLSGHNSGGLTRTIVHDYLTQIALPWITNVKSKQWENYLLVDRWWAIDKLSMPVEFAGFHSFGLHQMYRTNYDPMDIFFNMTMQRMWGVLSRKWTALNGPLTEDVFPRFFIQSLVNLYSKSKIADFCALSGLYPIDLNRAFKFTQQSFYY